jgi:hypothetical protein
MTHWIASVNSWHDLIPERMRRNGRPADNNFSPDESLFWRLRPALLLPPQPGSHAEGPFVEFKVPGQSVNRSNPDGEPFDVLLWEHPKYKEYRVAAFKVGDIPSPLKREQAASLLFRPHHLPEEWNYYHCEIRVFSADSPAVPRSEVTKLYKSKWRMELNQIARILPCPAEIISPTR